MHWVISCVLANLGIMFIEYQNRTMQVSGFGQALLITGLPILCTQWALFYTWQNAPSLMVAWTTFTLGNILLRVGNAYYIGETPNWFTWMGVLCAVGAAFLMKHGAKT